MNPAPSTPCIQPYLFFEGRCEEALNFYCSALGAEISMLMRFSEAPEGSGMSGPDLADKIMHSAFHIGGATVLASDGRCVESAKFQGFSLSLSLGDAAAAHKAFDALLEGGEVMMPMGPTFFAAQFGMVTDRFGVTWMILLPA